MIIETKRLILRKFKDKDLAPFAALNQDRDVMEHFPNVLTEEQTKEMIRLSNDGIAKNGYSFFAAEIKDTNEFIGFIGLLSPGFEAYFTPCVEVGWRLAKKYWGHGYASEGAIACLDFAFNKLGLDEIVSFTATTNKKSIAVMERIGMKYDSEFAHPKLPEGHHLRRHVLYKILRY